MWRNERFTSWMCIRQICRNCVMLSYQYGPKSLRNVSNTLLNLYHEELRQLWRKKGVQPDTSKVYLIKWPVSVFNSNIYSISQKWVHPSHFCKYFIISFHVTEFLYKQYTLYIVAKCHFFSFVTWKYVQTCEGFIHFCEILYVHDKVDISYGLCFV